MFDWVSSWILAIRPYRPETQPLVTADLSAWVQAGSASSLLAPRDTPEQSVIAAVNAHVAELGSWGWPTAQQGIWFQSGRGVLARHQGTEPLPAASLTKIATTLVALDVWGPDYQFETQVRYRGAIANGVLTGDLIIHGGGDPFFVWEEAIALGNALNELGIQTVTGDLVISGAFTMNFQEDPSVSGALLQRGMNATQWPLEAQQQFATMSQPTRRPSVTIQGRVRVLPSDDVNQVLPSQVLGQDNRVPGVIPDEGATGLVSDGGAIAQDTPDPTVLIRHWSVPLIEMLRQMNLYSNNFMAEALATEAGGAEVVASRAASMTGVPANEIQLVNGSGLGVDNRISARAVCSMLLSVQGMLTSSGWSVADVFPVAGLDQGTIERRNIPSYSAVKTGTLATVSALAGAIPIGESEQDVVWFAVINWGSDLDILRDQQDVLLQGLERRTVTHGAIARRAIQNQPELTLGAPQRNDIVARF
ncbi:MAG: D-alanyl-D-alanine carboxypeptidase [Cyanobacteria bacterium P01_E01_bin.6]